MALGTGWLLEPDGSWNRAAPLMELGGATNGPNLVTSADMVQQSV